MKIFVTGATGLVGSHAVRELISQGHQIRFLLRDVEFARKHFAQFGIEVQDYLLADMTDQKVMQKHIKGCDAVLHAAADIQLGSQNKFAPNENNYSGVKSVVGTAVDLGIRKILYVSSLIVMHQPHIRVINEETPLGGYHGSYCLSKVACEQYVRNLQIEGKPIEIVYPGGVFGPDDPRLNETNKALSNFIKMGVPITSSGIQIVDARDLAKAIRLMLERPKKIKPLDSRLIVAGHYYPWSELHQLLEKITQSKILRLKIPGKALRLFGSILDKLSYYQYNKPPLSFEAAQITTRWIPGTSQRAINDLGIDFRDGETTFRETLKWLKHSRQLDF